MSFSLSYYVRFRGAQQNRKKNYKHTVNKLLAMNTVNLHNRLLQINDQRTRILCLVLISMDAKQLVQTALSSMKFENTLSVLIHIAKNCSRSY